jgi:ATP-binding protein involved in chromosome partitioning
MEVITMKFAIPLAEGKLAGHFGHCQEFAIVEVNENQITKKEVHIPPPHEPGVLPKWLHELGADIIIAGGMGQRAISLFQEKNIQVVLGAPSLEPETLVNGYLNNTLETGQNICDH